MSNEWIEWNGGECPVPFESTVEYVRRDGGTSVFSPAGSLRWEHLCASGDIVSYRKVKLTTVASPAARDKQVAGTHYKEMGVEPGDVVDTWPIEQRIGAYRHGALKYLMRMGSKDESAQEIAKGIHYMEKLLEVLKSGAL